MRNHKIRAAATALIAAIGVSTAATVVATATASTDPILIVKPGH